MGGRGNLQPRVASGLLQQGRELQPGETASAMQVPPAAETMHISTPSSHRELRRHAHVTRKPAVTQQPCPLAQVTAYCRPAYAYSLTTPESHTYRLLPTRWKPSGRPTPTRSSGSGCSDQPPGALPLGSAWCSHPNLSSSSMEPSSANATVSARASMTACWRLPAKAVHSMCNARVHLQSAESAHVTIHCCRVYSSAKN